MKILGFLHNSRKIELFFLLMIQNKELALSKGQPFLLRMHNTERALPSFPVQAFAGVVATRYYTEVSNTSAVSKGEMKELDKGYLRFCQCWHVSSFKYLEYSLAWDFCHH